MDKRYLLIIGILLVSCINLYYISSYSDIVGSASLDCDNYTISMPAGFTFYESNSERTLIHNEENGMNINLYTNLDKEDTFDNKVSSIQNSSEFKILSKGNVTVDGMNIDCMNYQREKDNQNRSTFYFEKLDNPFRIVITDFNYNNDKDKTIDYVTDIITSLRVNYKTVKN